MRPSTSRTTTRSEAVSDRLTSSRSGIAGSHARRAAVRAAAVSETRTRRPSSGARVRSRCPARSRRSTSTVTAAGDTPSRRARSVPPIGPRSASTRIAVMSLTFIRMRRAIRAERSCEALIRSRTTSVVSSSPARAASNRAASSSVPRSDHRQDG